MSATENNTKKNYKAIIPSKSPTYIFFKYRLSIVLAKPKIPEGIVYTKYCVHYP